nr:hypothetical protein [Pandoravirus belohorizontensis]
MDQYVGKKKSNSVVARRSRQSFFSAHEVPLIAARPHWSHFLSHKKKRNFAGPGMNGFAETVQKKRSRARCDAAWRWGAARHSLTHISKRSGAYAREHTADGDGTQKSRQRTGRTRDDNDRRGAQTHNDASP